MVSQKYRIQEAVYSDSPLKVDRENGVIRGVKVLGKISKNQREYSDAAMTQAAQMYEGIDVNIDHPARTNGSVERGMAEGFGILTGVKKNGDGIFADLHYLKSHALAEMVLERAEKFPTKFGLSHNAEGMVTQGEGGTLVVESIDQMFSVDLVRNPATVAGLFESIDPEKEPIVKKTIKQIAESLDSKLFGVQCLREMAEGETAVAEMPVEMPAESAPDDQVKAAFRAMVVAAFDDESLDAKATVKKIGEILKAQEKLMSGGGEEESSSEESSEAVEESHKQTENAALTALSEQVLRMEKRELARNLLEGLGITPAQIGGDKMKLLLEQKDETAMQSLIESWPPSVTMPSSKPLAESIRPLDHSKALENPQEFANALR